MLNELPSLKVLTLDFTVEQDLVKWSNVIDRATESPEGPDVLAFLSNATATEVQRWNNLAVPEDSYQQDFVRLFSDRLIPLLG